MAKRKISQSENINEEVANKLIQGFAEAIFEIKEGIDSLTENKENYEKYNAQLEKLKEDISRLQRDVGKLSLTRIFMDIEKLESMVVGLGKEVADLKTKQAVTEQELKQIKENTSKTEFVAEGHKKAVYQQEVINSVTKDNVKEQKDENKQQEGKITGILLELAKWTGVGAALLLIADKMKLF